MHAMQYEITLPADYDMEIIRKRVATKGHLLDDFPGPVLFGLPSGHTTGACLTLPLGVRARVVTAPEPAVIIEEAAVAAA